MKTIGTCSELMGLKSHFHVVGCKVTGSMLSRSEITSAGRVGEHCRKSKITLYVELEVRGAYPTCL